LELAHGYGRGADLGIINLVFGEVCVIEWVWGRIGLRVE